MKFDAVSSNCLPYDLFGKQIKTTFKSLLAVIFKETTIEQEMLSEVKSMNQRNFTY